MASAAAATAAGWLVVGGLCLPSFLPSLREREGGRGPYGEYDRNGSAAVAVAPLRQTAPLALPSSPLENGFITFYTERQPNEPAIHIRDETSQKS